MLSRLFNSACARLLHSPGCSVCFVLLLLLGCGPAEPQRMQVYPVTGTLHVHGQPADHAVITMHPSAPLHEPSGKNLFPYAIVNADGSFQIQTYGDGDGAPPGEYALTVQWPRVMVIGGEEVFGDDQLRGRYNNPNAPVATIMVKEQENQIAPIQLK